MIRTNTDLACIFPIVQQCIGFSYVAINVASLVYHIFEGIGSQFQNHAHEAVPEKSFEDKIIEDCRQILINIIRIIPLIGTIYSLFVWSCGEDPNPDSPKTQRPSDGPATTTPSRATTATTSSHTPPTAVTFTSTTTPSRATTATTSSHTPSIAVTPPSPYSGGAGTSASADSPHLNPPYPQPEALLGFTPDPEAMDDLRSWIDGLDLEKKLRLLAHVHMDDSITGSIYQGANPEDTTHLFYLLFRCLTNDPNDPLLQEYAQLDDTAKRKPSEQELASKIANLKAGEKYHLPFGWGGSLRTPGNPPCGHALIITFEKNPDPETYKVYVTNTGDGSRRFHSQPTNCNPAKIFPFVGWYNITSNVLFGPQTSDSAGEHMDTTLFKVLRELNYSSSHDLKDPGHFLYLCLLGAFFNKLPQTLTENGLVINQQRSGTCSWRSLQALYLLSVGDKKNIKYSFFN